MADDTTPLMAAPETTIDPDLLALPAPPRRGRALAVGLLALTGFFAAALALGLASDVQYAFGANDPSPIGDLAHLAPHEAHRNRFVTAEATLDITRAVRYGRTTESDVFELAPVAGTDNWWVEMRMPGNLVDAQSGGAFGAAGVPPRMFVGRLVPMHGSVFRYRGLGRSGDADLAAVSRDAWVLIDGATPTSYRWTVALALLLVGFVAYSSTTIVRLVRPVDR